MYATVNAAVSERVSVLVRAGLGVLYVESLSDVHTSLSSSSSLAATDAELRAPYEARRPHTAVVEHSATD